jgi:hypothetical protein
MPSWMRILCANLFEGLEPFVLKIIITQVNIGNAEGIFGVMAAQKKVWSLLQK